ncbi:hypothetical protein BDM02DRAFT_3121542 [Thelephora ganbajun]|uniref:Uncharacterized protein n=1 Tax=Thelephora ganbajun TaxID=370292 RepID=A0ACB6Z4Z9_THEGA|nr:hypothetical protein BDM02DRAFT_3121542 [Thelephora ganbajun]
MLSRMILTTQSLRQLSFTSGPEQAEMAATLVVALQTDLTQITSFIRTSQNQYRPIFRLPNEVLAEIFFEVRDSLNDNTWMRVMSVCRVWRDVAISVPRLWSTIELDLDMTNEEELLGGLKLVLHRSKQAPLDVTVSTRTQALPVHKILRLDTLAKHVHRFRYVRIRTIHKESLDQISAAFSTPAPQLKTLRLGRFGSTGQHGLIPFPPMFSLDHPKLERLHCWMLWPEVVGRTLKFIFLHAPMNKDQQHQLALATSRCPNLKQLTLRCVGVSPQISQSTPIPLDGDIHLRLESPSPANMFYFSLSASVSLAIDMLTRTHKGAAVFPPDISSFPQMNNLRELQISEWNTQPASKLKSIIQVTAVSATENVPPFRIYRPYNPTYRSIASAIAILNTLLQPLDLTGVRTVTIKAFDPDPFSPPGQDLIEWKGFFSIIPSLETLTIVNSRASMILSALVPDVVPTWPWTETVRPDANAEGSTPPKRKIAVMCPRLKEIVLSNIESPLSVDEVVEMVNLRQKHGAPLKDVFVEGADSAAILTGLPWKEPSKLVGVINEVPSVMTDDHPGDVSKDDGLDDEMMTH